MYLAVKVQLQPGCLRRSQTGVESLSKTRILAVLTDVWTANGERDDAGLHNSPVEARQSRPWLRAPLRMSALAAHRLSL